MLLYKINTTIFIRKGKYGMGKYKENMEWGNTKKIWNGEIIQGKYGMRITRIHITIQYIEMTSQFTNIYFFFCLWIHHRHLFITHLFLLPAHGRVQLSATWFVLVLAAVMVAAPVVTAPMLVMMFVFLQLQGLANHWAGELKIWGISVKNERWKWTHISSCCGHHHQNDCCPEPSHALTICGWFDRCFYCFCFGLWRWRTIDKHGTTPRFNTCLN